MLLYMKAKIKSLTHLVFTSFKNTSDKICRTSLDKTLCTVLWHDELQKHDKYPTFDATLKQSMSMTY